MAAGLRGSARWLHHFCQTRPSCHRGCWLPKPYRCPDCRQIFEWRTKQPQHPEFRGSAVSLAKSCDPSANCTDALELSESCHECLQLCQQGKSPFLPALPLASFPPRVVRMFLLLLFDHDTACLRLPSVGTPWLWPLHCATMLTLSVMNNGY